MRFPHYFDSNYGKDAALDFGKGRNGVEFSCRWLWQRRTEEPVLTCPGAHSYKTGWWSRRLPPPLSTVALASATSASGSGLLRNGRLHCNGSFRWPSRKRSRIQRSTGTESLDLKSSFRFAEPNRIKWGFLDSSSKILCRRADDGTKDALIAGRGDSF